MGQGQAVSKSRVLEAKVEQADVLQEIALDYVTVREAMFRRFVSCRCGAHMRRGKSDEGEHLVLEFLRCWPSGRRGMDKTQHKPIHQHLLSVLKVRNGGADDEAALPSDDTHPE